MSNLIKPYEIAVYDDILQDGVFVEKRLGIIGSNEMTGLNRVIEPNLVRNVNGHNKFSFKMYKHYVDTITGEKTENPFTDWLVAERKVKLKYGKHINNEGDEVDTWYDFIVKDINENSSNYLYTYQLEDANVQELAKNGFGVTLDAELMNNIGTAKELGQYVMEETDWIVDGDVIVQTVEESLVYLTITSPIVATHILDQVAVNEEYPNGVTIDDTLTTLPTGTTILAFYSSCKNKPHRFQFIYSSKGYNKTDNGYAIDRNDKRVITEKDCQYYIDFDEPDTDYSEHNTTYDLYLPADFKVIEMVGSETTDTTISTWYRGARYGYAQQAEYVPLLERYCQKFTKLRTFAINDTVVKPFDHENAINDNLTFNGSSVTYQKQKAYAGIYFDVTYDNSEVYKLSYEVNNPSKVISTLGGHAASFEISQFDVVGSNNNGATWTQINITPYHTPDSGVYNVPTGSQGYNKYKVIATYRKINKEGDGYPQIYIQPNIYTNESCKYEISNISFEIDQNYYGYTDTEYISPTLVQNYITNYDFKTTSGWTPTQTTKVSSNTKPTVESFYGRYIGSEFRSIVDDYLKGTYSDLNKYTSYLKMEFKQANQFVLNSGIRDNRTIIGNMPPDEEWVLDYKIVDANNKDISDKFTYRLAEFIYDKESGGYSERTGPICIGELDEEVYSAENPYHRGIFKVITNNYTEDQFKGKKGSKGTYLNLQIKPTNPTFLTDNDGNTIPLVYYIEHIALYQKALDKNGDIIVPDYEAQESNAAQEYVDNSTLEHKYNYFNAWHVDDTNSKKIVDKEALPLYTTNTLKYDIYKPVYNTGAQKVRPVTVKESNYFNILQSIAETFEQWLVIEIERNTDGSIKENGKKIKFKNYRGNNNYACFRYGVNLKDIQRTYSSKNIVTKLIVKQNTNELGKDGFCTIQRAGANPTGENYIYDFQYLQNMGIMKADDYLTTNYYMTGAKGPDGVLWKEKDSNGTLKDVFMTTDSTYTLNGYFPRLKKINEAIMPLNQEIIGLNTDLVKENAKKEVAEAEIEASLSGIEQTRLDFHALTGVYPEDAQDGTIKGVSNINITAQDDWYTAVLPTPPDTNSVKFVAGNKDVQVTPREVLLTQGAEEVSISNGRYRIKSCGWNGLYVDYDYMHELTYLLTYDLEIITPEDNAPVLSNIGCHNSSFNNNFKITIKGINNNIKAEGTDDICELTGDIKSGKYKISVTGTFNKNANELSKPCLYIQPNRGVDTKIEYVVSNIKLYEVGTESGAVSYDRTVAAYVSADISIESSDGSGSYGITRTFEVEGKLPADATEVILPINITTVDLDRSDVKKYIEELTVYRLSNKNATETLTTVGPVIAAKEQAIELKNQLRKQYLDWKKQLNYLFFNRYSRFIQEGTWINEEYVDDDLYYADAQSVLYNSCYPQVIYTINTLELSQLPGYELFKFDLGDKTWAIDDEFFGQGKREEVIITELSEMLDDPSKNQIKVQNFKNQFQDLFQKITATVQQTQYNAGSYEKGDALLNANAEKKAQFITDAINNAKSYLNVGQETVVSDNAGITITDKSDRKRQLRLVGGAILFSTENPETKETTWRTGLTNEGISADLITAGRLDTGAIQIMSGNEATFRWDAYGLSAYDALWADSGEVSTISGVNPNKFVRFDKYGIYGINGGVNGQTWHPTSNTDVDQKATFALTWEGLKVTGTPDASGKFGIAQIGQQAKAIGKEKKDFIMVIQNKDKKDTFRIDSEGNVEISGDFAIGADLDQGTSLNDWGNGILNNANEYTDKEVGGVKDYTNFQVGELKDTLGGVEKKLQDQIDGAITSWFEEGEPLPNNPLGTSGSNYPASEWIKADENTGNSNEQIKHEGDLYYDKTSGQCYRWVCDRKEDESHGTHYWIIIEDNEVAAALKAAANAQATADGKMTVFNEKPNDYQIGDLWFLDDVTGKDSENCPVKYDRLDEPAILQATKASSGGYSRTDWSENTSYSSNVYKYLKGLCEDSGRDYINLIKEQADSSSNGPTSTSKTGDLCQFSKNAIDVTYYKYTPDDTWVEEKNIDTSPLTGFPSLFKRIKDSEGSKKLFASKPEEYNKNDWWLLYDSEDVSDDEWPIKITSTYTAGTLLVATEDSNTYNKFHWEEKVRYTDDTVANSKLDPKNTGTVMSYTFDGGVNGKGLIIWGGKPTKEETSKDYGNFDKDENIVLQVGATNINNETTGFLKLRGNGEFTGTVIANDGQIGNWILEENKLYNYNGTPNKKEENGEIWYETPFANGDDVIDHWTTKLEKAGYKNSFGMQVKKGSTVNAIAVGTLTPSDWSYADFIVKHTGEVICKNIKASGGEIAGFYISQNDLTIQRPRKEDERDDSYEADNIIGFISKGEQDGQYSVGDSEFKKDWFLWNRGGTKNENGIIEYTKKEEGYKGQFGIDMEGNLYTNKLHATGGEIGPWTLTENQLSSTGTIEGKNIYIGKTGFYFERVDEDEKKTGGLEYNGFNLNLTSTSNNVAITTILGAGYLQLTSDDTKDTKDPDILLNFQGIKIGATLIEWKDIISLVKA